MYIYTYMCACICIICKIYNIPYTFNVSLLLLWKILNSPHKQKYLVENGTGN